VVQALAANGPDQSFGNAVLPRRAVTGKPVARKKASDGPANRTVKVSDGLTRVRHGLMGETVEPQKSFSRAMIGAAD
jgi:hypothetical protein